MPERGRPPSTEPIGAGPTLAEIDTLYRTQSRRVLATLIRLLGDLGALEEALDRHRGQIAAIMMEPLRGDLPPDGYLAAVRALADAFGVLGRDGTLMMPSFNHRAAHVYNPKTSRTTNGAIPDAFWRQRGVTFCLVRKWIRSRRWFS